MTGHRLHEGIVVIRTECSVAFKRMLPMLLLLLLLLLLLDLPHWRSRAGISDYHCCGATASCSVMFHDASLQLHLTRPNPWGCNADEY